MSTRSDLLANVQALYTGENQSTTVLTDYSGNARHGSVDSTYGSWSLSSYLQRYKLQGNGSGAAATITFAAWLQTWQNGPGALACWFQPGTVSGVRVVQMISSSPTGITGLYHTINTTTWNRIIHNVYWRGSTGAALSSSQINDPGLTQWRHLVMQRTAANALEYYINGSLATTVSGCDDATNGDFTILGPSPASNGAVAELGFWHRVLTATEISWLAHPLNTLSDLSIGGTAFTGYRGLSAMGV